MLAILGAFLMVPLHSAQAQRVVIGVGVGPAYIGPPPVCAYGYYPYAPYACAPYGYYGPQWFENGIFLGVGPWYGWGWHHGWDRDDWGPRFRGRDFDDRRFFRHNFDDRDRDWDRHERFDRGFHGDREFHDRGEFHGDFHGDRGFRGRVEFHGEGNFHGGEHR